MEGKKKNTNCYKSCESAAHYDLACEKYKNAAVMQA